MKEISRVRHEITQLETTAASQTAPPSATPTVYEENITNYGMLALVYIVLHFFFLLVVFFFLVVLKLCLCSCCLRLCFSKKIKYS